MKENDQFKNSKRPMSCRPQTSMPKPIHKKESKSSIDSSMKDIIESERANHNSSKSITSKENFDVLDSVMKGKQKENFDNLIKEEANRLELIHKQKKNLSNVNLYEANIEGLYDWKTLFNNSRPLSCYTRLSESVKVDQEESKNRFKFPIALIDASEEIVAQYIPYSTDQFSQQTKTNKKKQRPFTSNPRSFNQHKNQTEEKFIKRKGNATRPQSMYAHRDQNDNFYLLKPFSDYYNEDLKNFSKKMPLVRAKVYAKTEKLKKTLQAIEKQTVIKENTLKKIELKKDLYVTPLELNIAGNLKNCKPLLKSIYKQIHPEDDYDFDPILKRYLKSAKPLGGASGEINVLENNRRGHIEEIKKLRSETNRNKQRIHSARVEGLSLPTYDENDPEVQIFNRIKEESIEEEHEIKQSFNYINTTTNNDYIEEHHRIIDYQKNGSKINDQHVNNNNKPRPKTGIVTSGGLFSVRRQQQRINLHATRPMTANQNVKASKSTSVQLNSTDLVSSYPNVNSSGSMKDTCSSSGAFDFIPVKSMPIRTTSAISNRTYQRIDQNLKSKVKKHKDDYLLTEEFTRSASLADNKSDVKIQATFRPLSSMYSNEYIKNKLDTINKNHRPEWNHISSPTSVNYIYFNNYIDTNFIPTTPNSNVGLSKFKHFHEQNYYTTHCFNKGTCGKQLPGKKNYFFSDQNKSTRLFTPKGN